MLTIGFTAFIVMPMNDLSLFQIVFLIIGATWSLFWKGLSMWRAAKQSDKVWFAALLVLNTAGILDILYLFVFSKRNIATQSD